MIRRIHFGSERLELGAALAAFALSPLLALILAAGGYRLTRDSAIGLFISTMLGPLLALLGAWIDACRQRSVGLVGLGLGLLLSLDGSIGTYFLGLPIFLLVLLSLIAGMRRQRSPSPEEEAGAASKL
ncbi:MAG: hypothetical protein ACR2PL_14085 [Dehalococcoidia bacterium]